MSALKVYCMHDILPMSEAVQITTNPNVSEDAITAYEQISGTPAG